MQTFLHALNRALLDDPSESARQLDPAKSYVFAHVFYRQPSKGGHENDWIDSFYSKLKEFFNLKHANMFHPQVFKPNLEPNMILSVIFIKNSH